MSISKVIFIPFLLFNFATIALAQSKFEEDFSDATKTWQEIAAQIPALPIAKNLIPFYVSQTTTLKFAIDAKSLTISTDGVIRYTLVTTSSSGAVNISYEGIRCKTSDVKLYAFGHKDGSWGRTRRNKWDRIIDKSADRQHAALAQDYFCSNYIIAGDVSEILDRIRLQRPLAQEY